MPRILLTCLLLLGMGLQVAAHNGPSQPKALRGSKKPSVAARPVKPLAATQQAATTALAARELGGVGQVEALAPMQPDSAGVVPGSTPEFDAETADLPANLAITLRRPAAPLGARRFRTRLVRTGHWASRREAVEILTCTDAGPLVLARLPAAPDAPAQVLAGPGYDRAAPLRALDLTQEAVLRLCGDRAPQVRAYAMLYNLHFQQADEVARLLDYYNRIAVVKE